MIEILVRLWFRRGKPMGRGQQSFISRWDDQFVLANPDQSPPPLDRACICRLRLVQRPGKTNYWMASAAEALERREFEQLLEREAIRLDSHERSLNERKTAADKTYTELAPLTLRAVGGDPATAVHVGDDEVLDVQGARAAGMRVIQVTGLSLQALGAPRPDAAIASLAALPDAIARLDA